MFRGLQLRRATRLRARRTPGPWGADPALPFQEGEKRLVEERRPGHERVPEALDALDRLLEVFGAEVRVVEEARRAVADHQVGLGRRDEVGREPGRVVVERLRLDVADVL